MGQSIHAAFVFCVLQMFCCSWYQEADKFVVFFFFFFFIDGEAPVLKDCPANQTLFVHNGESTVTADWSKPTATDNSGEIPTVTCDHDVASQFEIGRNIVQCTAHDASGNKAVCWFKIDVIGKLQEFKCRPYTKLGKKGFFPPLEIHDVI